MVNLKRLIWTYLTNDAILVGLIGSADNVKVAFQVDRVPKPGVTIQSTDGNKLVLEVHSVQKKRFLVAAWSSVGDEQCENIGERLFDLLDSEVPSDSNVFVYDSDVSSFVGPYYDDKAKGWRKDVNVEIIARSR